MVNKINPLFRRMNLAPEQLMQEQNVLNGFMEVIEQLVPEDSPINISWLENFLNGENFEERKELLLSLVTDQHKEDLLFMHGFNHLITYATSMLNK